MRRINLIPEAVRISRAWRYRARRWGIAIGVALLCVFLPVAAESIQYRRVAVLRRDSLALQNRLQQLQGEMKAVGTEVTQTETQLEHAEALRTKRAWSGLFALVAELLPAECWLTSLQTDPASPSSSAGRPLTESSATGVLKPAALMLEAPRRLRLVGMAPDPALPYAFVHALRSSQRFEQVSLVRSAREMSTDGPVFRFELECEW